MLYLSFFSMCFAPMAALFDQNFFLQILDHIFFHILKGGSRLKFHVISKITKSTHKQILLKILKLP